MSKGFSRRQFLKTAAASAAVAGAVTGSAPVHAGQDSTIRYGLIGCGGRGRGAASDALSAAANLGVPAKLVAMGDAFRPNALAAREGLIAGFEDKIDVPDDRLFDGLECYKQVIPECDVVLLCESPRFRRHSLRAAVNAGKHVFCEKPVAVDGEGIKCVLESAKIAEEKKLNLVSGLCWRYDLNVKDIMQRLADGAIGDITSVQMNYLTGKLWTRPRLENDTEMMFQVRNWYNFAWLSGDFNVEQHVHSLDKGLWAMGNTTPVAAYGMGGRMARTEQPDYGDIYDEMSVVFEYPNGRRLYSLCRQQNGCWGEADDYFMGTKGYANVIGSNPCICDLDGKVIYEQKKVASNMYVLEHEALIGALTSGGETYINNGQYMANSTMLGILGRAVCYTGARLTWEEGLAIGGYSPDGFAWDSNPPTLPDENGRYKVAVPGMGMVYHSVVR